MDTSLFTWVAVLTVLCIFLIGDIAALITKKNASRNLSKNLTAKHHKLHRIVTLGTEREEMFVPGDRTRILEDDYKTGWDDEEPQ